MMLTYEYWLISRMIIIPLIFIIGIFLIAQQDYTKTEDSQILMGVMVLISIPFTGEMFAAAASIVAFCAAGTYVVIYASNFIRNKVKNQEQP